ncbi:hypothetical protein McanMca71_001054 [Microsporum canis]
MADDKLRAYGLRPESRVLIIMTGGTICMRPSPSGFIPARGFREAALEPSPVFNDGSEPGELDVVVNASGERVSHRSLRTPLSTYNARVRYAVYEFEELLDSSSIDAKGWAQIARAISWNYTIFDAFVVLHGTDSLAYTCSALSFMLQNLGKPVILTGSQTPMLQLQNDAVDNLLGSLVIAGHFMIPEVCLYFDGKLFRGNRTTKVAASDFAAFASPNAPPLATTSSMKTDVAWDLVKKPTSIQHFRIRTNLDTTHVACLRIFPGIQPEMVDSVLRLPGLRGLVLETFGAGNAPSGQDNRMTKVLADAIKRGIVIVNVTQCLSGSVSPVYATGMTLSRAGVVAGGDMTTEAALTKLAYLLAMHDATPESVARDMSISLRGELSDRHDPLFRHPDGTLPDRVKNLTALGYAISHGDLGQVTDIMRGGQEWLLNDRDYSGNTPLHLSATSPDISILRYFLLHGSSVHIRNNSGKTPLFLAANAGLVDHVELLRRSGAHLHADELTVAELHAKRRPDIWALAGVDVQCSSKQSGDLAEKLKAEAESRQSSGTTTPENIRMPQAKTIAIVNATGRQAASLIRVAAAVGYDVRAQVHTLEGVIPQELASLPGVTLFQGPLLDNVGLMNTLFQGATHAFINTTSQAGDEVAIGRALADAAKRAGTIQHYVYSSMPDHSVYDPNWISLPLWSCKFAVENYIRQLGLPATFVYAGIYNNNFTSLPYPLFCMELMPDGGFEWRSPFPPSIPLPWLDAEHDVGPTVLQLFKDGPKRWNGDRIALAFETLTPRQVCAAFSRALQRPCRYKWCPRVEIKVSIPSGYREQLEGIEVLFGQMKAPYFPNPEFHTPARTSLEPGPDGVIPLPVVEEARSLWEGWRSMEEYAREAFPVEEEANGLDWML